MAYIVMVYRVMACIVMVYRVMAYIVMASDNEGPTMYRTSSKGPI